MLEKINCCFRVSCLIGPKYYFSTLAISQLHSMSGNHDSCLPLPLVFSGDRPIHTHKYLQHKHDIHLTSNTRIKPFSISEWFCLSQSLIIWLCWCTTHSSYLGLFFAPDANSFEHSSINHNSFVRSDTLLHQTVLCGQLIPKDSFVFLL